MKLTGVVDMVMGGYNYYDINKQVKNKNIIKEDGEAQLHYHKLKSCLGAIRFAVLGVTYGYMQGNGSLSQLDAISIGLMTAFAASHIVDVSTSMFPNLMEDESVNNKRFQNKILGDNEIFNHLSQTTELSAATSYHLFMVGNRLATGNPIDKILFKMKEQISQIQSKWTNGEIENFNIVESLMAKAINGSKTLSAVVKEFVKDSPLKVKTNDLIRDHAGPKNKVNEFFMTLINAKFRNDIRNEKVIEKKLQVINQTATIDAYNIIRQQNMELFFSKVVLDYNKGIKHSNLIEQFINLQDYTSLPAKNGNKKISIDSYKNISKIAFDMKYNKKIYDEDTNIKKILTDINPDIIKDNKIQLFSFNNVFEFCKRKVINKELDTYKIENQLKSKIDESNYNIRKDKKVIFNEIELDNSSFEEIIKIKEGRFKKADIIILPKNKNKT